MTWDRQHVQTMIGMMGYEQDPKNEHIWKQTINGKVYGADFKKEEAFVFIGTDRITDLNDGPLNELKTAIEYASVESSERQEPTENKATNQENQETPANVPSEPKQESTSTTKTPLIDLIKKYVRDDVLELFGDTGAGKSKFALKVAQEAMAAGKSVFYLDTERNLTDADIAALKGCQYKYTPVVEEIVEIVANLPKVDFVIVDSVGFPVLTTYAKMTMNQKGEALLKLIAIFGDLKKWTYQNKGIAIVTNQPESEFNKPKGYVLCPFGDKSQYAAKEIWWLEPTYQKADATRSNITAFRSRSMGRTTKIAGMTITGEGVEVV